MVRKIKAKLVLRLRAEALTGRHIAAQGVSRMSVAAVIDAAEPDHPRARNLQTPQLRPARCHRQ